MNLERQNDVRRGKMSMDVTPNILVELVEQILLSNFVELQTINRTNRILTIFNDFQIVRQKKFVELL